MAYRVDRGELKKPKRRADGSLVAEGFLTRTGVFTYRNRDGSTRREYRPPEEVFKEDSLASFAMVPVTDDHPPEAVTSRNAKQFAVGMIGEMVRKYDSHVAASILVFDDDVIRKMDSGKNQLSCGYDADLLIEPGVSPEGERYDAIQINIRGNHVAIVDVGRAGPSASIRMDSAEMVFDELPEDPTKQGKEQMEQELKEALAALELAKVQAVAAESTLQETKVRADRAEAERDAALADKARIEKERTDSAGLVASQVKARVDLEVKASKIIGDVSTMSDRAIKVAVVEKLDGVKLDDAKSEDYVAARFDVAIERQAGVDEDTAKARSIIATNNTDKGTFSNERDLIAANKSRAANAWKEI